jgi:purine-nucleoside phosphorylase
MDQVAESAARLVADRTGVPGHDVAVVLGSGWAPAADRPGWATATLSMELPGLFPRPRGTQRANRERSWA